MAVLGSPLFTTPCNPNLIAWLIASQLGQIASSNTIDCDKNGTANVSPVAVRDAKRRPVWVCGLAAPRRSRAGAVDSTILIFALAGDGRAHSIRMHYANVSRPSVSCQVAQRGPVGLATLQPAVTGKLAPQRVKKLALAQTTQHGCGLIARIATRCHRLGEREQSMATWSCLHSIQQ